MAGRKKIRRRVSEAEIAGEEAIKVKLTIMWQHVLTEATHKHAGMVQLEMLSGQATQSA